jgi:phosphonate transport system substrate-binding protein
MKAKVLAFFLGYGRLGTPEEVTRARDILKTTSDGWGVFAPSSNAQLYPIRQLELFKSKTKMQNDDKMAADEKAKKIAEIDAKLAELDKAMASTPNM